MAICCYTDESILGWACGGFEGETARVVRLGGLGPPGFFHPSACGLHGLAGTEPKTLEIDPRPELVLLATEMVDFSFFFLIFDGFFEIYNQRNPPSRG